jgi:hypothetical protein
MLNEMEDIMSGSGEWMLFYDWGCSGSYGNSPITFSSDGTLSLPPYTGEWYESDGKIMWRFDVTQNTTYSGDQVGYVMTGISSTFAGLNGCWYALPLATQEKRAAVSVQEVDVAGNKTGSG